MAEHFVDGALEIAEQEDTLNFIEQAAFGKVVAYVASTESSSPANVATIEDSAIGDEPGGLHLVAVASTDDPAPAIATEAAAGRVLAFRGNAFVTGQLAMVLAFR
jgi:hypothetical protein